MSCAEPCAAYDSRLGDFLGLQAVFLQRVRARDLRKVRVHVCTKYEVRSRVIPFLDVDP